MDRLISYHKADANSKTGQYLLQECEVELYNGTQAHRHHYINSSFFKDQLKTVMEAYLLMTVDASDHKNNTASAAINHQQMQGGASGEHQPLRSKTRKGREEPAERKEYRRRWSSKKNYCCEFCRQSCPSSIWPLIPRALQFTAMEIILLAPVNPETGPWAEPSKRTKEREHFPQHNKQFLNRPTGHTN
ncbi:hypothetical protein Nepgr_033355 [Nepenthes gracilis]|uniref:Uncharacterized protein n=1 Tax=Nepenthes gracilis TaxID=150966 RepID=A0AAD3Y6I5_NEPGR|nr:hypothetical protein Nepgr_033355 [Nepenthes gracilis]